MVQGRSPLRAPTPPDINLDDESPFAISPDTLRDLNKTEAEKTTREKKNKQRASHRIRAERQRQAQADYRTRMVEYDHQRLARKAEDDQCREDERRRRERRAHEERIAGSSSNLKLEFMLVRGHKVYKTPYVNIYTLAK
jgi:hypothetical protein